jgi:hypothetical protein
VNAAEIAATATATARALPQGMPRAADNAATQALLARVVAVNAARRKEPGEALRLAAEIAAELPSCRVRGLGEQVAMRLSNVLACM